MGLLKYGLVLVCIILPFPDPCALPDMGNECVFTNVTIEIWIGTCMYTMAVH